MNALTAPDVRGVRGMILLPPAGDGAIDWEGLGAQIDALAVSGVDGIYAHGTAGASRALGENEFDRINTLLAERCEATGLPGSRRSGRPHRPAAVRRPSGVPAERVTGPEHQQQACQRLLRVVGRHQVAQGPVQVGDEVSPQAGVSEAVTACSPSVGGGGEGPKQHRAQSRSRGCVPAAASRAAKSAVTKATAS
ncbi:hypothetical protein [Nonomuraea sp. NPDC050202]|jgi:hypothetical protein|uniref:hypothetical protein n=1 Tax=Nonomuraea sp. NPDC050202 TaxID=3155035 RepID=UPI0034083497